MISIIIILKNDLDIVETISFLNKQNYNGEFEIIVIDRSTIKYPSITSKISLKWIIFDPKEKKYTIPEQRNRGIKESSGDIICFIDANCIPKTNWLSKLVAPIKLENENIVAGVTLSKNRATLNDISYFKLGKTKYIDESGTNNLTFKKSIIKRVGLFDENLEYGSDVDFTWRAINAGYRIRFEPEAISYHDWGDTKEETKRSLLYGKGRTRILIKNIKTHWRNLFSKDSPVLLYPTLILLLPVTIIFPLYPLVFLLLVLKNYKEPNPIEIVLKHIVYGWGVIIEVTNQLLNYVQKKIKSIN